MRGKRRRDIEERKMVINTWFGRDKRNDMEKGSEKSGERWKETMNRETVVGREEIQHKG